MLGLSRPHDHALLADDVGVAPCAGQFDPISGSCDLDLERGGSSDDNDFSEASYSSGIGATLAKCTATSQDRVSDRAQDDADCRPPTAEDLEELKASLKGEHDANGNPEQAANVWAKAFATRLLKCRVILWAAGSCKCSQVDGGSATNCHSAGVKKQHRAITISTMGLELRDCTRPNDDDPTAVETSDVVIKGQTYYAVGKKMLVPLSLMPRTPSRLARQRASPVRRRSRRGRSSTRGTRRGRATTTASSPRSTTTRACVPR